LTVQIYENNSIKQQRYKNNLLFLTHNFHFLFQIVRVNQMMVDIFEERTAEGLALAKELAKIFEV